MSKQILILILAFCSGFALMSFEILGSRLLTPYFGGTIYVWGALISVLLTGSSLGYAFGGRLADKRRKWRDVAGLLFITGVLIMASPLYGRLICYVISLLSNEPRVGSLLASLSIFFLPAFLLGVTTPYLIKLSLSDLEQAGTRSGLIHSLSTFGCVLGTVFTSFFLILWVGTSVGLLLSGLPLLACSGLALIPGKPAKA